MWDKKINFTKYIFKYLLSVGNWYKVIALPRERAVIKLKKKIELLIKACKFLGVQNVALTHSL